MRLGFTGEALCPAFLEEPAARMTIIQEDLRMKYIDMHCDTISEIWYSRLRGQNKTLRRNDLMIDLERLKKGDCLCQNLGLFVDLHRRADFVQHPEEPSPAASPFTAPEGSASSSGPSRDPAAEEAYLDPWYTVSCLVQVFREELAANADLISQVTTGDEIRANEKAGRMSALMSIEEGGCCKGSLEHLKELYDAGARMMTLTWNHENELASPNHPDKAHYFEFVPIDDHGLKKRGVEFVEAMQDLGMLVDVSHLSDAGFYDVCRIVKGPFVASHSNARAVCGCGRNLTDDMIRKLAEHGGVTGINFCPEFLEPKEKDPRQSLKAIAAHARHIMNVGGRECLGIGTDFDGIDGLLDYGSADKLPLLAEGLEKEGFTQEEIESIFYKNVLRVYDEVL